MNTVYQIKRGLPESLRNERYEQAYEAYQQGKLKVFVGTGIENVSKMSNEMLDDMIEFTNAMIKVFSNDDTEDMEFQKFILQEERMKR